MTKNISLYRILVFEQELWKWQRVQSGQVFFVAVDIILKSCTVRGSLKMTHQICLLGAQIILHP